MRINITTVSTTKKVNVRVVKKHRTPFGRMFIRNKDIAKLEALRK